MAIPLKQFTRQIAEAGLVSAQDVQTLLASLPAEQQPKDGQQLARLLVREKKLTAFQAQQVYAGKGKGLVLGNYVVLDKLGQGGMGMVLKAEHRRMKRLVALKVLSPGVMSTPEALRRFQREVEAAAKLTHPNIVTAYDADEAAGRHFLVMEYAEGTDLSALVKRHGPLLVERAWSCVLQVARGLEYAHRRGVVHRDIKPSNLLLDDAGTVKILDMGLARLDTAGPQQDQLTGTGQIMGTVDFMAPEQAMDTRHADARADIYSLGVTLWYLLTGRALYTGDSAVVKLMAHQSKAIPSLRECCPVVSEALDAVFIRMVAKTPESRYQTMADVIADLERCRPGDASTPWVPTSSSEDTQVYDLPRGAAAQPTLAAATQAAPKSVALAPALEATVALQSPQADTDPKTEQSLVSPMARRPDGKQKARSRWRVPVLVACAVGAAALVLAGIVLFWQTDQGTVRIEINDPAIAVLIDGQGATITGARPHEIKLALGQHGLRIKYGELDFETDKFVLARGETVRVKVELLAGKVQARQGETLIGEAKVPETANVVLGSRETNYALAFDGASSHVSIPTLSRDEPGPVTIEAWVNGDRPFGSKLIVTLGGKAFCSLSISDKNWFSGDSSLEKQFVDTPRTPGLVHLAYVRDEREGRLYLDGIEVDRSPRTKNRVGSTLESHAWLGAGLEGNLLMYHFQGQLREVRISQVARYTRTFKPDERFERDKDTLALYHFDEGQGDVLNDSSGNNHHGKIVGAKWVRTTDRPGLVNAEPPVAGNALHFDGQFQGVEVASLKLDRKGPYTIEAYVTVTGRVLKPQHIAGPANQTSLSVYNANDTGGSWVFSLENVNGAQDVRSPAGEPGRRVHLAAVRAANEMRLFVDGQRVASKPESEELAEPTYPFMIGGVGFEGIIAEVRVSTVARYDEDFRPTPRFEPNADTLALYHMDEGQGDVLTDSSGNNHHGKIVGAKWKTAQGWPADAPPPAIAPFDAAQAKVHQEAWARYLGVPVEYTNSLGMKLRLIPPGEAKLHASIVTGPQPISHKQAKPIYAAIHKVTIEQFRRFVKETGYRTHAEKNGAGGWHYAESDKPAVQKPEYVWSHVEFAHAEDLPVTMIAWQDANAFCDWLSRMEGRSYRFPTESELIWNTWAGSSERFYFGDDLQAMGQHAWLLDNSGYKVQPVGGKKANPWGLFDAYGNVNELCFDWVKDDWVRLSVNESPAGPSSTDKLLVRGGSYHDESLFPLEHGVLPASIWACSHVGFRVVLTDVAGSPPLAVAPFDSQQARAHQEAWAKHLGTTVETTNGVGAKMILIPPGEFLMGAPDDDADAQPQEKPQHKVRLTKPFYIGATEVTVGQFRQFVDATKYITQAESDGQGAFDVNLKQRNPAHVWTGLADIDEKPVRCVSWEDARRFCEWLGQQDGRVYRLPTDAEWEFACRAGTTTRYSFGNAFDYAQANAATAGSAPTRPVAQYPANPFGLFDMHGNAHEICWDSGRSYSPADVVDPVGPKDQSKTTVVRGGAVSSAPNRLRSTQRFLDDSRVFPETNFATPTKGFRIVAAVESAQALKSRESPSQLLATPDYEWSPLEEVAGLHGEAAGPCIAADDMSLWFHAREDRTAGAGRLILWNAWRQQPGEPFGEPTAVESSINDLPEFNLSDVTLSADGLVLCFCRSKPHGEADLWLSTRASRDASWLTPKSAGSGVNSEFDEWEPELSADGLELFFHSDRADGQGGTDLWVSRRSSRGEPFGPAENLGADVNSSGDEGGAALSSDGLTLLFHRLSTDAPAELTHWQSTRTAVGQPFGSPRPLIVPGLTEASGMSLSLSAAADRLYVTTRRGESLVLAMSRRVRKPGPSIR